jgi:hypothetical protein
MGEEDSRYTVADVQKARSEFRQGLQSRIKDYINEIEREDRKRASSVEWDEARAIVDQQEEADLGQDAEELADESLIDDLLEQFNRQDGGEEMEEEVDSYAVY